MTTKEAEARYIAQHERDMEGKKNVVYNPEEKEISELPVIYGYSTGRELLYPHSVPGYLIGEKGNVFRSQISSNEEYLPSDLGVLEGESPGRHEEFKKHYPNGYRMEFVKKEQMENNKGFREAYKLAYSRKYGGNYVKRNS